MKLRKNKNKTALTVLFAVIAVVYLLPIFLVLMNSFKSNAAVNLNPFAIPDGESFVGWANYIKGMTFGNYPFFKSVMYSVLITVLSVALILVCTSMAAWYISRVGGRISNSMMIQNPR